MKHTDGQTPFPYCAFIYALRVKNAKQLEMCTKVILTAPVAWIVGRLNSSLPRRQDASWAPYLQILFDLLLKIVPPHCYDKPGTIYIPENSSLSPTHRNDSMFIPAAIGVQCCQPTWGSRNSSCDGHFQIQNETFFLYKRSTVISQCLRVVHHSTVYSARLLTQQQLGNRKHKMEQKGWLDAWSSEWVRRDGGW
jgi:hypothetical protein